MFSILSNASLFYLFWSSNEYRNQILQASALIKDICKNLRNAAESVKNADYTVVLRGDSTLRGHFPEARTVTFNYIYIKESAFLRFVLLIHAMTWYYLIPLGSRCCYFSIRQNGCMDHLPLFSTRRPLYNWWHTLCCRFW